MSVGEAGYFGHAYSSIGERLVYHTGNPSRTILFYVEAGDGWTDESIFIDNERNIEFIWPDDVELGNLLFDIWESTAPDKRWAAMEYVLQGGRFTTRFGFADELDPEQSTSDRREAAAKRIFGDKPIHYPPLGASTER